MNDFNPYVLITPSVMAFLGLMLLVAWQFDRRQRALCWMALGILISGVSLGVQSVLAPHNIAHYAIYTSMLYLTGAWLCGCSMAAKFHSRYPLWLAIPIVVITWCAIYYYSRVNENLPTRAYCLSMGLGLLHTIPIFQIAKHRPRTDMLDICMYWTYLAFGIYTASRPVTLLLFERAFAGSLVDSVYWFVTLMGGILFSVLFAFLMLGSTILTTFKKLQSERNLDPLTNLLNRRAFDESVAQRLRTTQLQPGVIVIGDIDHFKHINDSWGHDFGDQILRNVAQCLQQNTRTNDLLARFGGEEFVLLLPHTHADTAHKIVQRIQNGLAKSLHLLPSKQPLTMSFGMAILRDDDSVHDALKRADLALYQAKKTGRNRICMEAPVMAPSFDPCAVHLPRNAAADTTADAMMDAKPLAPGAVPSSPSASLTRDTNASKG